MKMKAKNKIMTRMNMKRFILVFSALILTVLLISFISAQIFSASNSYSRSFTSYSPTYVPYSGDPGFPLFDRNKCEAGQDFILQIDPLGCEPSVVRSDILEDQNVPVFCPIVATQLNPMIEIETISTITFSFAGPKPKEVVGVTYVPARAALGRFRTQFNQPVLNKIGYAVIVLRKQINESIMPEFILGNLTAKIRYDIKNAFGVGRSVFYLPQMNEDEWEENYLRYGFWDGRGYLRAEGIDNNGATISVYSDRETYGSGKSDVKRKLVTLNLNVGESSRNTPLPGFDYCFGTMQVQLKDLENPGTRVNLKVNGNVLELKEGEKFIDNKCTIKYIENHGINEKVTISCQGDTRRSSFQIGYKPKLKIDVGGEEKTVKVGQKLYKINNDKSAYLAYAGTKSNIVSEGDLFIVIMSAPGDEDCIEEDRIMSIGRLMKNLQPSETPKNLVDATIKAGKAGVGVVEKGIRRLAGQSFDTISFGKPENAFGKSITILGFADATNSELSLASKEDSNFQNYYSSGNEDYDYVLEDFSQEKSSESGKTLGPEALSGKINLAFSADQKRTALELCNEFKATYPNLEEEQVCKSIYAFSSSEKTFENVVINGRIYNINFGSVREPSLDEFSATINIRYPNGERESVKLRQNTLVYLGETTDDTGDTDEYIQLLDLQKGELDRGATARIRVNLKKSRTVEEVIAFFIEPSTETLSHGVTETFRSKYQFTLEEVNLKKVAKVSINPKINYARTNATFGFKIGIEKRLFQLSPEKTRERIEFLNKTLEKWQNINKKIGTVVSGFKAACLGIGTGLTVKNFFSNLGGRGLARQEVMRGDGGWFDFCEKKKKLGDYRNVDACLLNNSDKINRDVNIVSEIIENQEAITSENAAERLIRIRESLDGSITNPNKAGEKIEISKTSNVGSAFSEEGFSEGKITPSQARDLDRLQKVLSTPNIGEELKELSEKKRYDILADIKANTEYFSERINLVNKYGVAPSQIEFFQEGERVKAMDYSGLTYKNIQGKTSLEGINNIIDDDGKPLIKENTPIVLLPSNTGKTYIVVLDDTGGIDKFPVARDQEDQPLIYNQKDGSLVSSPSDDLKNAFFKRVDRTTYENAFENAEVRYYESGAYAGFPAIVPFDLQNGWYAYIKPTMPIGGAIRAYDASGVVRSFYICNVGGNNKAEFNSGIGDDSCEGFTWGGQPPDFSGLDKGELRTLKNTAEKAILAAQRQHRSGVSHVSIISPRGASQRIKVGNPETGRPDIQCQDFMSPSDCNLMFNVCDPVACPSSRCDLGGAYPVKDVVQTGIAGSIFLCLPNFPEVKVPVCLSGIHAGIESLLTVFDSYQQCLQTSLDTGQTVGVCDEINSVYLCDLIWRQGIPLAKIIVTEGLGTVLGQKARGGGEYLGVKDAWQRSSDSIDFFTQQYAASSFKSFKGRSVEDVGTSVCKNFISFVGPSGFDTFITPDSPVQFYGRFDEIPFTTATNPPVSQYKVFYHVYAGKDFPAYYQVYLRGTGGSFYQDASLKRIVAQGFIKAGDYFTETRDLTAPSGYHQMCIIVNGQEECGFKQVTTSFGVNYVAEKYVESQASQTDITTEAACRSGTPNVLSLLSPNIQAGATEITNPALYNRGITRICATDNPGKATDAFIRTNKSRWQPVGYCGDTKMQCWLDTNSVKTTIKNTNIEDKILEEVTPGYIETLEGSNFLSDNEFKELLKDVEEEDNNFRKINIINADIDKVYHPTKKASLILLRANLYRLIVSDIYDKYIKSIQKKPTPPPTSDKGAPTTEEAARKLAEIDEETKRIGTGRGAYPIFEFKYGGVVLFKEKTSIYYSYSGNNWYWALDRKLTKSAWHTTDKGVSDIWAIDPHGRLRHPFDGLSEEMQKFTSKFVGESYSEGLKLLIDRTTQNKGKGLLSNVILSTKSVELSHKERFTVKQQEATDVYFEFDSSQKKWRWSPDKKNWAHVPAKVFIGKMKIWDEETWLQNEDLIESLDEEEPDYYNGAETIFSIDALAFQEGSQLGTEPGIGLEIKPGAETCFTLEECQKLLGGKIIEMAREKKLEHPEIDFNKVKEGTRAESFECLALMVARVESNIRHCKRSSDNLEQDPLYCEEDIKEVISGDEDKSLGIMQINKDVHGEKVLFEENVKYGINLLIDNYDSSERVYSCYRQIKWGVVRESDFVNKAYSGWKRALRSYNGWNTRCTDVDEEGDKKSVGNPRYVEDVLDETNRNAVMEMFPECAIETESPLERVFFPPEAELLRGPISQAISYRRGHINQEQGEEWANAILRVMIDWNIPLEFEHVSLIVSTIERESDFRADPLTPNIENIIQRKLQEIKEGGEWLGLKYRGANRFYEKYKDQIREIKTEKQLEQFLDSVGFVEKLFVKGFRPETVGSMQLNVEKARVLAQKYSHEDYSDKEMRSILYTQKGGVYYGVLYLNEIINVYTDYNTKPLDEDRIKLIAADYQSGLYSSRNAALQNQLNVLLRSNLALDGDIGDKTMEVVEEFLIRVGREDLLTRDNLKTFQASEKEDDLEDTIIYHTIKIEYEKRTGNSPEYAIIPENVIDVAKYGTEITSEGYVRGTYARYMAYCQLLGCFG